MTFLTTLLQTIFKMIIIGATALGGVLLGIHLRKKKDNEDSE